MEKAYKVEGYRLLRCIGEGMYALVFLAESRVDGSYCAIKAVHKGKRRTRGTVHARKEIAALGRLAGVPGVAVLKEWQEDDNTVFLVLSLHTGHSLEEVQRFVDVPESLRISRSILEVLKGMHARGVYHLDIKPANVILGREGVVLVDFGCAIISESGWIEEGSLPFEGTPAYMAPEMVKSRPGAVNLAALDVWSFGCLLYYLVTGKDAFQASTLYSLYPKIVHCEMDMGAIPPLVATICRTIFVPAPDKRIDLPALTELLTKALKWAGLG
ncbi:hypothetical protein NEHOM01_0678 [Nematocida homosporus]|uniref:uncharacterized protein n=1 Tax=Nematocida homosporus TaxID=1912981 RepID=UPI00221F7F56|nr:uncharacterized protein NEHOM01_0678 [Nematocida homosporus]KAI5185220.1 hypothetical protein NEHOM01_0678 [Nematocida homosporus]